jgi:hypothetical protein
MKSLTSLLPVLRTKTTALLAVLVLALGVTQASAQTYYNMSSGDYSENFNDIADTAAWPNAFNGTSSTEWRGLPVNATGTIPDGVRISTVTNVSFSSGTSGGVQRGTNNIQLLSTGGTDNSSSAAIELYLNFTGRVAGTLSYDAATVFNSTGDRKGTLRVYASVDGTTYTEITGTNLPYVATNNVAGSGSVSVALPSSFNNAANARLRFYYHNGGTPAGTGGSRPKISIDNLAVTSTAAAPEISIESPVSTIVASGGSRDFGTASVGSPVDVVFRVKNLGGTDLNVSGITFGGTHSGDFTVVGSSTGTISGGGQQDFTLRFTPGAAGSRSGTVTFANDDSDEGSYLINLDGTGSAAALAPTVTSGANTAIGTVSSTFNGTVNADGGAALTDRGFAYSDTDATPTLGEGGVSSLSAGAGSTGAFTATQASGLVPNTDYFQQAYATNSVGTSYGGVLSFTTLPTAPTAGAATGVTASTFTANWTAPGAPFGAASFTYTLEVDDASDFSSVVSTTGIATTSASVTGLDPGVTYYYRVRVVNAAGVSDWSGSTSVTTTSNDLGLTTIGVAVTENFDGLANSGTANTVLPTGWLFAEQGTNANTTYAADNMATTNSGNTYSLGATGDTDRAFGGLQSGSLIPTVGARVKNNTGSTVVAFQISYTGETWRVGTADRADRLNFQISTDATSLTTGTWTDVDDLDYANPGQATGSGSIQHSLAVSSTITGLSIAPGDTVYIRWNDSNASGSDDAMGIDDFSITPLDFVAAAPEIALFADSVLLVNGGTDNIGNQDIGVTVGVPYDIANNGDDDLTLGAVSVTGTTNATATVTTQPDTTVSPLGITSTVIDVTPTTVGPWTVTLSVTTNDADENPTTWTISGNGRSVTPISLAALNTAVTQDFDSLVNTGTSSLTPTGWFFEESGTGANTTYGVTDGSTSSGDVYSLGTASSSERAFGTLRVGTLAPTIGARIKNDTGSTITSLAIAYTGETWRVGAASRSDSLIFEISEDATSIIDSGATWTAVTELDYTNPGGPAIAGGSLQDSDAISHTITGLNVPAGATFFIRWNDTDVSGSDDAMGIDDFSITPAGAISGAPEIQLKTDLGTLMPNGASEFVGSQTFGVATAITYNIDNTGDAALTLSAVTVTGTTNASASVTTQPATSVAASGTTSTVISVTPTTAGAWSVNLSVTTNDSDENPTTWTVSGTGQSAFATWTAGFNFSGGDSSATGDPNNDGINNLESYALDIDPVAPSGKRAKVTGAVDSTTPGGPWFTTTFRRSLTASGVNVAIRASTTSPASGFTNLTVDGVDVIEEIVNADVDGDGSAELVRLRIKISLANKRFFDLNVTAE